MAIMVGVQVVILGLVSLFAMFKLADSFGVEWFCLFGSDWTRSARLYFTILGLAILVTGIALIAASIYLQFKFCVMRPWRMWLIVGSPLIWFLVITAAGVVAAASIGPQPCE